MQAAVDENTAILYEIRGFSLNPLDETTQRRGAIQRRGNNQDTAEEQGLIEREVHQLPLVMLTDVES